MASSWCAEEITQQSNTLSPSSLAPNSLGCPLGWVGLDTLCTLRIPGCPDERQALLQPPPLGAAPFPGFLSSRQAAIVLLSKWRSFQTPLATSGSQKISSKRKKKFTGWRWKQSFWVLYLSPQSVICCLNLPCLVFGPHQSPINLELSRVLLTNACTRLTQGFPDWSLKGPLFID